MRIETLTRLRRGPSLAGFAAANAANCKFEFSRRTRRIANISQIVVKMLSCASICLTICAVLATTDVVNSDALDFNSTAAMVAFLESWTKTQEVDYGNVHFVMNETHDGRSPKRSWHVVTEIKFWSRENRYFRMDSVTLESTAAETKKGSRSRIVVEPDGFVLLYSDSENAPLTIRAWGSFDDGLSRLAGNFFFRAAANGFGPTSPWDAFCKFVPERFEPEVHERARLIRIGDVTLGDDGASLEIVFTRTKEPYFDESVIVCDVPHGVVLKYDNKTSKEGIPERTYKVERQYDFQKFRSIPKWDRQELTYPAGDGYTRTHVTKLVSWDSVPLGIFSLDAQGLIGVKSGSAWPRRMLTLAVGLALLGLYGLVTWLRKRSSD